MSDLPVFAAEIANTESLSDAIEIDGNLPVVLHLTTDWTAAVITFQASLDKVTYDDVYYQDAEYQLANIPTSGGAFIVLDPRAIPGAAAIKIRSGTSAAAQAQGGDRAFKVACRGW